MNKKEKIILTVVILTTFMLSILSSNFFVQSDLSSTIVENSSLSNGNGKLEFNNIVFSVDLFSRIDSKVPSYQNLSQKVPTYANPQSLASKSELEYYKNTYSSVVNNEPQIMWLAKEKKLLYPFHSFL